MTITFTDRFGQEYDVLFSGRDELLPPRPSGPHPLNVMGHRHGVSGHLLLRTRTDAERDRARSARFRRHRVIERAVCMGPR